MKAINDRGVFGRDLVPSPTNIINDNGVQLEEIYIEPGGYISFQEDGLISLNDLNSTAKVRKNIVRINIEEFRREKEERLADPLLF